jgi:hypothetical protein
MTVHVIYGPISIYKLSKKLSLLPFLLADIYYMYTPERGNNEFIKNYEYVSIKYSLLQCTFIF